VDGDVRIGEGRPAPRRHLCPNIAAALTTDVIEEVYGEQLFKARIRLATDEPH
jgi:hypothetical protein